MKNALAAALLALASFAAHADQFVVQVGSFDDPHDAMSWAQGLLSDGVPAYVEKRDNKMLVRAGPFASRSDAEAAVNKITAYVGPKSALPATDPQQAAEPAQQLDMTADDSKAQPVAQDQVSTSVTARAASTQAKQCKAVSWVHEAAEMRDSGMREHDAQLKLFSQQRLNSDANKAYDMVAVVYEQGANFTESQIESSVQDMCDSHKIPQ